MSTFDLPCFPNVCNRGITGALGPTGPTGPNGTTGLATFTTTLSLSGQPSFTDCVFTLQQTNVPGVSTMVNFQLYIHQTITATSAGLWASPVGVIPSAYRPSVPLYFPCIESTDSTYTNTYFIVDVTGYVAVYSPASSG